MLVSFDYSIAYFAKYCLKLDVHTFLGGLFCTASTVYTCISRWLTSKLRVQPLVVQSGFSCRTSLQHVLATPSIQFNMCLCLFWCLRRGDERLILEAIYSSTTQITSDIRRPAFSQWAFKTLLVADEDSGPSRSGNLD